MKLYGLTVLCARTTNQGLDSDENAGPSAAACKASLSSLCFSDVYHSWLSEGYGHVPLQPGQVEERVCARHS